WTLAIVNNPTLRGDLLQEQLAILATAPPESIDALIEVLLKLRASPRPARVEVLERFTKIYVDFSAQPALHGFLERGVTPLGCLRLEANRTDTSLISSGWTLLLRSQNNPHKFAQ